MQYVGWSLPSDPGGCPQDLGMWPSSTWLLAFSCQQREDLTLGDDRSRQGEEQMQGSDVEMCLVGLTHNKKVGVSQGGTQDGEREEMGGWVKQVV